MMQQKTKKIFTYFFMLLFCCLLRGYVQGQVTIENIRTESSPGEIKVWYDLEAAPTDWGLQYEVTAVRLRIERLNGKRTITPKNVRGNTGVGVRAGKDRWIAWDCAADGYELREEITPILDFSYEEKFIHEPQTVFVQGGTFQMGSNDSEAESDEKPVHSVTVSSFHIGKYEVTVAEFAAFVSATGYQTDAEKGDGSYIYENGSWTKKSGISWRNDAVGKIRLESEYNHPVIHVSWQDAVAYCEWLSKVMGKTYRLPTEAEWEYVARGGTQSKGYKYSGSNNLDEVGWYWDNASRNTHSVGGKQSNELGVYDMSGNVWEWCSDWYDAKYYSSNAVVNPTGASTGSYRVLRGGSWYGSATYGRCADRNDGYPTYRSSLYGFRVLLIFQ